MPKRFSINVQIADAENLQTLIEVARGLAKGSRLSVTESGLNSFNFETYYANRHAASVAANELLREMRRAELDRGLVQMACRENEYLLEDLLKQAESKTPSNKLDDWYLYYLTPRQASALRRGQIKTYLDLAERRHHIGTSKYGTLVKQSSALRDIKAAVKKLKEDGRLGLVVAIEMLRDCERSAYFGPFIDLTGNYRTKLNVAQQLMAPKAVVYTIAPEMAQKAYAQ